MADIRRETIRVLMRGLDEEKNGITMGEFADMVLAVVEPLIRAQYDEWITPEQHEAVVAVTKVRTERWVREQIANEIEMRCQQIHHGAGDCPHCGPIIRMIRIKEE